MEVLCMRVFSVRKANNMNVSIHRCDWAEHSDIEREYHDHYWGIPVYDEQELFRMLMLEGQQAGLSWKTILYRRENFRKALDGFDVNKIALYDEAKIQELMQDVSIIRNQAKIRSTVTNAKSFIEIQNEFGSFDTYIWQFTNYKTIENRYETTSEIPARSPESDAMSAALKKRGFKFVGSTICYAFMQAAGMINDHLISCPANPLNK